MGDASMAPGREYLPASPDGFEGLVIRLWRREIDRRHACVEGLGVNSPYD